MTIRFRIKTILVAIAGIAALLALLLAILSAVGDEGGVILVFLAVIGIPIVLALPGLVLVGFAVLLLRFKHRARPSDVLPRRPENEDRGAEPLPTRV